MTRKLEATLIAELGSALTSMDEPTKRCIETTWNLANFYVMTGMTKTEALFQVHVITAETLDEPVGQHTVHGWYATAEWIVRDHGSLEWVPKRSATQHELARLSQIRKWETDRWTWDRLVDERIPTKRNGKAKVYDPEALLRGGFTSTDRGKRRLELMYETTDSRELKAYIARVMTAFDGYDEIKKAVLAEIDAN